MKVDLNSDLGESFGQYVVGADEMLMPFITSASIACGYHAGDPLVMDRTVRLAVKHGVAIGAHPGLPDLAGFGRRQMQLEPDETENYTLFQIGALAAFARAAGVELAHVKPHGALYNMAARDLEQAGAIVRGIRRFSKDLIVVCLAASAMVQAAEEAGIRFAREGFADRAYSADGTLRSRTLPGALIVDPKAAAEQAIRMAHGDGILAYTGEEVFFGVDTLCIHSDTPTAAEMAKTIRRELEAARIEVLPLQDFV